MRVSHNVQSRYAVTVKKKGNNHGTFTTKVVTSVFVVFATRWHDILYSDWEEQKYSTVNQQCFNYCQQIFDSLIFVALLPYENFPKLWYYTFMSRYHKKCNHWIITFSNNTAVCKKCCWAAYHLIMLPSNNICNATLLGSLYCLVTLMVSCSIERCSYVPEAKKVSDFSFPQQQKTLKKLM